MKTPAATVVAVTVTVTAALVDDEIQIYNADIAAIGRWTFQQHLNYTLDGRKQPDFSGGLVSNHALNGTPEWAYRMTDWWEIGSMRHLRSAAVVLSSPTAQKSAISSSRRAPRKEISSRE
jgi:hypothetical protein